MRRRFRMSSMFGSYESSLDTPRTEWHWPKQPRITDAMVRRAATVLHDELCPGCTLPIEADVSYHEAARKALAAALEDNR